MIHSACDKHRSPAGQPRPAQGDAGGGASGERSAAPNYQGAAAASVWTPRGKLARGTAAARPRGGPAGRSRGPGPNRGERSGRAPEARRASPDKPWCFTGAPAAYRNAGRCGKQSLPRLLRPAASNRGRCRRAARHRAGAVPSSGRAPTQIRLSDLRGSRGAGAGAGSADRRRPADRGNGRPGAGVEICGPSSIVPASADLCPPGRQPGSLDTGRLGWTCSLPVAPYL